MSRKILKTEIAIKHKTESNDRLRDYITMEQEKLEEAKKFLAEDREKFRKLIDDSEKNYKKVQEEVKVK